MDSFTIQKPVAGSSVVREGSGGRPSVPVDSRVDGLCVVSVEVDGAFQPVAVGDMSRSSEVDIAAKVELKLVATAAATKAASVSRCNRPAQECTPRGQSKAPISIVGFNLSGTAEACAQRIRSSDVHAA